jgi:hypothetical protein
VSQSNHKLRMSGLHVPHMVSQSNHKLRMSGTIHTAHGEPVEPWTDLGRGTGDRWSQE